MTVQIFGNVRLEYWSKVIGYTLGLTSIWLVPVLIVELITD